MDIDTLRREEQQVHRESNSLIVNFEGDRRGRVDAKLNSVEMSDVVFKVTRRSLLISSVKQVNSHAVGCCYCVGEFGEFHNVHLFGGSPFLPPSRNLPFV